MFINRHNYEVFLVDYLDGKLKPSLVAELLLFLDQNPEVKNELDGLKDVILAGEPIAYPYKSNLKKKIFLKNGIDDEFEYLCIASVEGTLSEVERTTLNSILSANESKQKEFQFYQKLAIQPDTAITFPIKSRLKRTSTISIRYSTLGYTARIAASIALLLGIYSIGKMLIHPTANTEIPKTSIVASSKSSFPKEVTSKPLTTEIKTKSSPKQMVATFAEAKSIAIAKKTDVPTAEPIPSEIASIKPKEVSIPLALQYEQLALVAATYHPRNHLLSEQLSHQEPNTENIRAREIGVFEIIQFGVQSFGRLIGRDFKLSAKKDINGNFEKISFESNLIAFSTPIRKKE